MGQLRPLLLICILGIIGYECQDACSVSRRLGDCAGSGERQPPLPESIPPRHALGLWSAGEATRRSVLLMQPPWLRGGMRFGRRDLKAAVKAVPSRSAPG